MAAQSRNTGMLALCLLALLLAAPLLAAPPAPVPQPTMVLQVGHTEGITALAYSPDGQTLATGGGDGVRLWDTASGQVKASLPAGSVPTLAFAPDGQTLATGSDDGTVRLWDAASGRLQATLPGVTYFAFSPDGKTLTTESLNTPTVQLWDVVSGQLQASLTNALAPLFSPDGKTLVTKGVDANGSPIGVQLWDVASGQLQAVLQAGNVSTLAFSPNGRTLATRDWESGSPSGPLHLWDVASASSIPVTAQTSLAQFPAWFTHPFSWSPPWLGPSSSEVSLLDPIDGHVLATLQALPDAPASLLAPPSDPAAAPPTGDNWITTTPDGYFEGSANLAAFIRWNVDGMLYPAAAYWDVYYRPDLVQQALKIPEG